MPENLEVAELKKVAEQGDVLAQYILGGMYYTGQEVDKDYTEAAKWWHKAVDQGNIEAQASLGWMYEKGLGVTKNYAEAFNCYLKAAEQGNVRSQFNLGRLYDKGWGTEQDHAEAEKWFAKAAKQGDEDAQKKLIQIYGNDRDGQKGRGKITWPFLFFIFVTIPASVLLSFLIVNLFWWIYLSL